MLLVKMKKTLIIICITAFINYLGCSSTGVVTLYELKNGYASKITILTKDNKNFIFESGNYRADEDSLYGRGIMVDETANSSDFNGKLAYQDIEIINGSQIDGAKTTLLILGLGVLAVIVVYAIAIGSAFGSILDWD